MSRLRSYRDLEGLRQDELGDLLGLPVSAISAVERGERPLVLDMSALGYSSGRVDVPNMSEPLHRQRAATKAGATKRAKELLRLAGETFRDLSGQTSRAPKVGIDRLPAPQSVQEIESAATEVRYMLGIEEGGPIRNLTTAVERAGICLVPLVGLSGIDGMSAWVENAFPVVGVNPAVSGDRFRFTIAHELGHLCMHRRKTECTEDEANRFAGALLIPQDEIDAAELSTFNLRDFGKMKAGWGISIQALVYRAHECGHIDSKRYRALQIQMSRWRDSEPGSFDPSVGQLLPKLINVNGGPAAVSRSLGLNPDHLSELSNWSPLRVVS